MSPVTNTVAPAMRAEGKRSTVNEPGATASITCASSGVSGP